MKSPRADGSSLSPAAVSRFFLDAGRPIVGIDVGEDFLDLAALESGWKSMRYGRIRLDDIRSAPIGTLAGRLIAASPQITADTLAIVDSPRWPRDLSIADNDPNPERAASDGRVLDRTLRAIVAPFVGRLSMFPTPELDNFLGAAADPRCKPHLRAISAELWKDARPRRRRLRKSGNIFTRFMLVGFALYRALERIGVEAAEGYPDLQFRLCFDSRPIAAKRAGRAAALTARAHAVSGLARQVGLDMPPPGTLDAADAAVLALGAAAASLRGKLVELKSPREGRFIVALPDSPVRGAAPA